MSNIRALDKLREVVRCGEAHGFSSSKAYYDTLDGCIAEIEREHSQRVAELNGAVCERDGRIGSYERRNTELNDALKAICKRFGVSTEWGAEDTAKKVLEALERGWIELPVDAEGVPIRYGDSLAYCGEHGEIVTCKVSNMEYREHSYGEADWLVNVAGWIFPGDAHHVKPRTLEDVLRDYAVDFSESSGPDYDEEITRRYADEIRELMGGERMTKHMEFYIQNDAASMQIGKNVYRRVSIPIDDFNAACDHYGFVKERTCHDVNEDDHDFTCSECGASMYTQVDESWTMIARGGRCDDVIESPNYCPNCGAKVVSA